ncbi:MAG: hypothetical protein IBJ11_12645, partial [Phycisphaerales bacterium]|nr:hypothetical protein [Phycisphaerales bacterium]
MGVGGGRPRKPGGGGGAGAGEGGQDERDGAAPRPDAGDNFDPAQLESLAPLPAPKGETTRESGYRYTITWTMQLKDPHAKPAGAEGAQPQAGGAGSGTEGRS